MPEAERTLTEKVSESDNGGVLSSETMTVKEVNPVA